jgi:hypothetical protein
MTSLLALVHPGHGVTEPSSWRHYLTEPVHVLVVAGALAGLIALVVLYRRERRSVAKTSE